MRSTTLLALPFVCLLSTTADAQSTIDSPASSSSSSRAELRAPVWGSTADHAVQSRAMLRRLHAPASSSSSSSALFGGGFPLDAGWAETMRTKVMGKRKTSCVYIADDGSCTCAKNETPASDGKSCLAKCRADQFRSADGQSCEPCSSLFPHADECTSRGPTSCSYGILDYGQRLCAPVYCDPSAGEFVDHTGRRCGSCAVEYPNSATCDESGASTCLQGYRMNARSRRCVQNEDYSDEEGMGSRARSRLARLKKQYS